jgi:hypothetical protein
MWSSVCEAVYVEQCTWSSVCEAVNVKQCRVIFQLAATLHKDQPNLWTGPPLISKGSKPEKFTD